MASLTRRSDAVHRFLNELGARVVAESGIPSDRHHLGKLILQSLKDAPNFVMQIDATTGMSETYSSVLDRTVRCAAYFKKLGLIAGDVVVVMAPSHVDMVVPLYAAIYLGMPVAALDACLEVLELETMFKINKGKVIFCQSEKVPDVKKALNNIKLESKIITFDESNGCTVFSHFMKKYGQETDVQRFKATDIDPSESIAILISTSGTTGYPKSASLTHTNLLLSLPYLWIGFSTFPTPTQMALITSPLHWITACFHYLFSPIIRYTRLQISASAALTQKQFVKLINTYKPTYTTISPTLLTTLMRPGKIDFTCFDTIFVGGSAVPQVLLDDIRKISPKTYLLELYGMSEIGGLAFYDDYPAPGSLGRPIGLFEYRIVDIETKEDITEPNVNGELWLKGPAICKGYYNNPEATEEAFEEGGWLRTGDIFYRDEHHFFYFVDRLKLLLKYKSHQISPVEVEAVIRQHPGVLDVAVTGIPDPECGDLAVACVVPKSGHSLTTQEVQELVKNSLSDSKQLRGGVVFMTELPMTSSTKVHRRKLKEMILTMLP